MQGNTLEMFGKIKAFQSNPPQVSHMQVSLGNRTRLNKEEQAETLILFRFSSKMSF